MLVRMGSTDVPSDVPPVAALQLSWADGEAVAWQPGRGMFGKDLPHQVARLARRPSLAYASRTRVVPLDTPDGRANALCQILDPATLASLGQLEVLHADVSPSVAWFGAVHNYATRLVTRGRVLPRLGHVEGSWWHADWRPLPDDVEAAGGLLQAMPPAVAAPSGTTIDDGAEIVDALVDQLCRHALNARGWTATLGDTRSVNARAVRLLTRALMADTGRFAVAPELVASIETLADQLDRMRRRAGGEPILRARLRLDTPGSGDMPDVWPLTLELVDVDDRGRWCTMGDVAEGTPAALALARSPRFLPLLDERLRETADVVADVVPEVAPWLAARGSSTDLDGAAATLEAVETLEAAGVELVAPERLVRRRPTTRGTAQPKGGDGRFAATALVEWNVVVDNTPVSDEALRRAAEEGANLIDVGGRWVLVDRTEAGRALANLRELRAEHQEMTPVQLLALAADLERSIADAHHLADDRWRAGGAPTTPMVTTADASVIEGSGWIADLLQGLPDAALAEGKVPEGFTATLRHYQLRGLGWLQFLRRLGLGGCLADDMGLGKTPTTLAHLAGLPGPHLVVCPLSVVRNWESETARFAPLMRVMVHHGASRADDRTFAARVAEHDLVVTTYQVATRDVDVLRRIEWSTLVLDEAQAVKNPDTRAARAMGAVHARQVIALTGTPVENRLGELWSIFHIVLPGLLGTARQFRQQFGAPIERERDASATAALRLLTAPFLLRRTKADRSLVPDLPDKVEQIAWAPLTREQAQMYQAVVDQLLVDAQQATGMRRRGLVLAALTRLKQICNHPAHALGDGSRLSGRSGKLHRFDELVTDLLDAGEQALVFTQFRQMGLLLQQHLVERFGQHVPFLHGGVPKAQRDRMVAAFQHSESDSPLLLVSLKAGGTGLNLTAASRVVHYDRWWNPAVEDQATDRAWRIGQRRAVFVHKLVCEGTVEERIDKLINDKRALAEAVIGSTGETWLSELTTDELRDLVVLDQSRMRGQ